MVVIVVRIELEKVVVVVVSIKLLVVVKEEEACKAEEYVVSVVTMVMTIEEVGGSDSVDRTKWYRH